MIDQLNPAQKLMLANAVNGAKHNLEAHGELMPTAFIGNSKEKSLEIVGAQFGSQKEKEMFSAFLKSRVSKGTDTVILCLEAWYLEAASEEEVQRALREGVSANANKREGIMISVECRQGSWSARLPISRTKGKPSVDLKDLKWDVATHNMGLFTQFIPVKGVPK